MEIMNRFSVHPKMSKKSVTEMQKEDRYVVLAKIYACIRNVKKTTQAIIDSNCVIFLCLVKEFWVKFR